MADHPDGAQAPSATPGKTSRAKQGARPVRVGKPRVVPIRDDDLRQAVTALAALITSWWDENQGEDSSGGQV